MKEKYIDLIEKAMDAYTAEHIKKYCESTFFCGITEHGFPRLTSNLGILISHGRKMEYKDILKKMMDFCCKEIPTALIKNPGIGVGNDFSVKTNY